MKSISCEETKKITKTCIDYLRVSNFLCLDRYNDKWVVDNCFNDINTNDHILITKKERYSLTYRIINQPSINLKLDSESLINTLYNLLLDSKEP